MQNLLIYSVILRAVVTLSQYSHNKYKGLFIITKLFPVWLRKQLISAGLEPILSHTEKSCKASTDNFPRMMKSKS